MEKRIVCYERRKAVDRTFGTEWSSSQEEPASSGVTCPRAPGDGRRSNRLRQSSARHAPESEELGSTVQVVTRGDAGRVQALQRASKFKPRYAFDLVGDTYVPTAYDIPKRFLRVNIEGTMNVLLAAKTANVERILYVSSTEVYRRGQARADERGSSRCCRLNTPFSKRLSAQTVRSAIHQRARHSGRHRTHLSQLLRPFGRRSRT